jgi:hypothetical protein
MVVLSKTLVKVCQNEAFTDEELLQGNRARENVIPLLDQTTYELDHLLAACA